MQNFTDLTVRSLPQGTYYDPRTPGFGIRIGKNRKTWIVLRGSREKRTQTILGHYPSLSLQDARKRALVALGSPLAPRDSPAFPEALEAFLAQDRWRPRSFAVLKSSLKHFQWTRPLDKITHEDVAQAIENIEGKTAKANALKDIRTFFNWCIPRYLQNSPAVGLKKPTLKPRDRVLSHDELRRVWIAASEMEEFGTIIRLCILTGQRRGELSSVRPHWIQERTLTIPATSAKNNREHSIPCSDSSLELLKRCPFSLKNWDAPKERLDKICGVSNWTIHDLRRTFATNLAALKVPIHVTEKLLNHVSGTTGGIVGVYQTFNYWDDQVEAVQKWETRLKSLVG